MKETTPAPAEKKATRMKFGDDSRIIVMTTEHPSVGSLELPKTLSVSKVSVEISDGDEVILTLHE